MWWIALAAIAAGPSPAPGAAVARQAQAVVRIVRPARVRLGEEGTDGENIAVPARKTLFRDADGSIRPARLVEFS